MFNKELLELLMFLGINPDKKGFIYLELVTMQMYDNPSLTLKDAYEKIALSKKVSTGTIDSSIRNVIHYAFDSGKLSRLNLKMGMDVLDDKICPTNKAFISFLMRCFNIGNHQISFKEIDPSGNF
ncbi:MAG: hypothetical protein J1F36_06850 [Clostridiales bacterium]|nr:hypothetical protein [Clostridiales bacterium]